MIKILDLKTRIIVSCMMLSVLICWTQNLNANVVDTWTGKEGDLVHILKSTKGSGVPIIIMPAGFGPQELAKNGRMYTATNWAKDVILGDILFQHSPFFRDVLMPYFDVYVYIRTDIKHPIPEDLAGALAAGKIADFGQLYALAESLTVNMLDKKTQSMHIIYLGNSHNDAAAGYTNVGQVGGHAYGGQGAFLTWGNRMDGISWEGNPPYWALHEFWGHVFARFRDEYEFYTNPVDPIVVVAPNVIFAGTSRPSNVDVPWFNFIGFQDDDWDTPIDIYQLHANTTISWFPTSQGFMNGHVMYVSMYHKWILYKQTMEYAGIITTLTDFCELMGITLTPPPPDIDTEEAKLRVAAMQGGTYKLEVDFNGIDQPILTRQLSVISDFTSGFILDLNGRNLTVKVAEGAGIDIGLGKTFTIVDNSPEQTGTLTVEATGENIAGIRVIGSSSIIIESGTVTAITKGRYAAGIGGVNHYSVGDITITGGNVKAQGGHWGAGIGGGNCNAGTTNIIISGGKVSAAGGEGASSIGGGQGVGGVNISISGGIVDVGIPPWGTGIGNGNYGTGAIVSISGGTIGTSGTIGTNRMFHTDGGLFTITGGSINTTNLTISGEQPKNDNETNVYLTTLTLEGVNEITEIEAISSPSNYGINDMFTDADGKLYVWLPTGTNTPIELTANDIVYTGEVTITTDNKATATLIPKVTPIYEVTVNVNIVKAGTVDISDKFVEEGSTTIITANANDGYEFVNWITTDGTVISEENPLTITVICDTTLTAIFEDTLGITENNLISSIRVLPNPATVDVIIEINCIESQENTVVAILDISGSEMFTVYLVLLNEGINNFSLPDNLPSGTYILLVKNNNGQKTEQFIITK